MDFDHALVDQVYRPLAAQYGAFYFGLPPPTPVLLAQIMQESSFNSAAKSRTGALGPLQLMPATWKWAADAGDLGPAAPTDPKWAVRAGTWFDKFLFDRAAYARDCDRWGATLSGYNGGAGWANKRQALADDPSDFWTSVRLVNPGISAANQRENETYPAKIIYQHQALFVRVGDRKVCIS